MMKRILKKTKENVKIWATLALEAKKIFETREEEGVINPVFIGRTSFMGKEISLWRQDVALVSSLGFPGAFVHKMGDQYRIVVNEYWVSAPEFVKRGILAHELGHVVLGHLEDPRARFLPSKMRAVEIEADAFAKANGHGEGMVELLQKYDHQLKGYINVRHRLLQLQS
jgi:hypothetical protein